MSARLNRIFTQPLTHRTAADEESLWADWTPAVDIQETDGEFLVKADLPEVKKEDVTVEIQDGMLCVRGERHEEKEEKGKKFHRIERAHGRFERRLAVPAQVETQKVAAEFKDGVLKVHLPKTAAAKPKAIDVKVA
jgi:HSP20 family protein